LLEVSGEILISFRGTTQGDGRLCENSSSELFFLNKNMPKNNSKIRQKQGNRAIDDELLK